MTKLYLDTNILVYCVEDSFNFTGKDISLSSTKLLLEAISCKYELIISNWTIIELNNIKKLEKLTTIFKLIEKKIIKINYVVDDLKLAKKQNFDHFQDELHGILAIKSGADYIVTRNVKDFQSFEKKIKIVKPEELL